MLQKGETGDVSLHRESGKVLDVEDSLDFGDCYGGLVAVSILHIVLTARYRILYRYQKSLLRMI